MKYKHYRCRFITKSGIGRAIDREYFSIPLVWHRAEPNSWPLPSTKTQTHVLLITDISGLGHIVASPMKRRNQREAWNSFCDDLYACWWAYLPCALPPRNPYKKRYSEAELSVGYTRWKVHQNAVMDEHGDLWK